MRRRSILFLLSLVFAVFVHAQMSIFNEQQPEIHPVWHRIGDVSPKLRAVEAAEFSPNGLLAVSGSKFGYQVILWNVLDGSLIWENHHESEVECVVFSPDNKRIATGGEDFYVRVWDVETGNQLASWEHPSGLDGITWSSDGKIIASGSEDGRAFFWDADTYQKLWEIKVGSTINSLDFTKDGHHLAVGGNHQNPDPSTGKTVYTGFAKLIDMDTRKVIKDYGMHDASIKSVRISPNGKFLATGGFANQVKVFDFKSGEELKVFNYPLRIEAVAFTPDGNYLLSGGHQKQVNFYRTFDFELAYELPCPRVEYIDVSKDGRLLLTAHEDSGMVSVYMFLSNLQHKQGLYHQMADEQLNNRDLKHK